MNIILPVSDTFRYDHLGFHGNDWIDTRDLDAFARKCAVFENCYYLSSFMREHGGGQEFVLNK